MLIDLSILTLTITIYTSIYDFMRLFLSIIHVTRKDETFIDIKFNPHPPLVSILLPYRDKKSVISRVIEQTLNQRFPSILWAGKQKTKLPTGLGGTGVVTSKLDLEKVPPPKKTFFRGYEWILRVKKAKDAQNVKNMKHLIEDEHLTVEMGSRAKEMALKEFTIEKSTRNIVEALKPLT